MGALEDSYDENSAPLDDDPSYGDDDPQAQQEAAEDYQQPQSQGPGPLSASDRSSMAREAEHLRGDVDKEYSGAMAQQQARANSIRDALRASRMRLVNEHPDKSAMWMSISAALGAPIPSGGGLSASLAQGAGAAVPYLKQQEADKTQREDLISRYDEALAGYGNDPNAVSPDLTNLRLKLADLKSRQAASLTAASTRGGGAGGAGTPLGKLLAEMTALPPNDPQRALYQRQIDLLQKKGGGAPSTAVPGNTNLTGEAYLATIPADIRGTVKALAEGRQAMPNSRVAAKDPRWATIMSALAQYDPTFDVANAPARQATYKSFTSGADSDNKKNIGTAIHHLFKLKTDYGTLDNTRFAGANWLYNKVVPALGGQQTQGSVADVETDAKAVAHELAGVFRRTGMSEKEIDDWQNSITTSATPATSGHIIASALDLMNGRLYELAEKYNRGMGTTKEPLDMLAPEDRKLYEQLTQHEPREGLVSPGIADRHGASGQLDSKSFKSVADAEAAGFKAGDTVMIGGVKGKLR